MRRIHFVLIALFTLLFASCQVAGKNNLPEPEGTVKVSFGIDIPKERTALPEFAWDDFQYVLQATENYESDDSQERTLISNGFLEDLEKSYELKPVNYKFDLYAYYDAVPVMAGSAVADLSNGSKTVTFKMYPVTGSTGAIDITVKIPNDTIIRQIKACWSTNPVADLASCDPSRIDSLELSSEDANFVAHYQQENLPAGTRQFAIFYFYDAQGGLIHSVVESLVVLGGHTSVSTVSVESSEYGLYAVAVSLKKDGSLWISSKAKLTLVSKTDPSIVYKISDMGGTFTGSVAEDSYYVYFNGQNTGVQFASTQVNADLDFYSIDFSPQKGSQIVAVSEAALSSTGAYLVQKGTDFNFNVYLNGGYKTGTGAAVMAGTTKLGSTFGADSEHPVEYTLSAVSSTKTVSTTGIIPITYTITYDESDASSKGTWQTGCYKPTSYTAEDDVNLPTAVDYKKSGKVLDGWKIKSTGVGIGYIQAGVYYENLVLSPIWKDSAYADTASRTVYANGISLIIKASGTSTVIYLDIDGDGNIDAGDGDIQLVAENGNTDFTGYDLKAGNKDPSVQIASDFTFTMTGGQIASITGLGAEKANRSVLNISGTAVIGSYDDQLYDADGDGEANEHRYTNVKGVDLSSIYKEWVVVTGQMSGEYRVVVVTQYDYDANTPHYIGYIGDYRWANFSKFNCFKSNGDGTYENKLITMKNVEEGGVEKTIIRLANPDPIAMPGLVGDDAIIGDVNTGFTLGEDRVSSECSVFSVIVKNGSFRLGDTALEGGTSTLAQLYDAEAGGRAYDETLRNDTDYIYLHILSSSNQITPENASDFLSKMIFKREANSDIPIQIDINLETVPFEQISAMGSKFSYFNGSFYMGVNSGKIRWDNAYNAAKNTSFNGMNGYLINITSRVENDYIYKRMGLGEAWTGGARIDGRSDYDSKTVTLSQKLVADPAFKWQSGPEAGQTYTSGTFETKTTTNYNLSGTYIAVSRTNKGSTFSPNYYYTGTNINVFNGNEVLLLDSNYKTLATISDTSKVVYETKNKGYSATTLGYNSSSVKYMALVSDFSVSTETVETPQLGASKFHSDTLAEFTNWESGEPNDYTGGEQCMHFRSNGQWNDYSYDNANVIAYIVEFTPYNTAYGKSAATYQSIVKSASY